MNWKLSTIVLAVLSTTIFIVGADFSGESPVPSDRKNVAPFEDEVLKTEKKVSSGVVSVGGIGGGGFGTGFVVHEDGYIFTNAHVIAGCITPGTQRVHIGTKSGRDYTAKVVAVADRERVDFGVLKLEQDAPELKPLEVTGASNLEKNQTLFTVGHPGEYGSYVTAAGPVTRVTNDSVKVDMPTSQGASGSPIFNPDGEVVSILSGGSQQGGNERRDSVIWHGNSQEYEVDSVTSGERMKKAEEFFREEFSEKLADEIFGGMGE